MERADGGSKKSTASFFITFLQGGQGRFRFLPLGPPAPPRNPIETIAPRRGTALYAEFVLQFKLSPFTGKVSRRSRDERGMAQSCQVPRVIPPQSAYADSSPASGGAFWWYLIPKIQKTFIFSPRGICGYGAKIVV